MSELKRYDVRDDIHIQECSGGEYYKVTEVDEYIKHLLQKDSKQIDYDMVMDVYNSYALQTNEINGFKLYCRTMSHKTTPKETEQEQSTLNDILNHNKAIKAKEQEQTEKASKPFCNGCGGLVRKSDLRELNEYLCECGQIMPLKQSQQPQEIPKYLLKAKLNTIKILAEPLNFAIDDLIKSIGDNKQ